MANSCAVTYWPAGIPAGAVRAIPQVLTDPHTLHRDMVVQVEGVPGIGIPVKLSRTPGRAHSAPPRFGQHTITDCP